MKFIKLTYYKDGRPVWLNPQHIGHIIFNEATYKYGHKHVDEEAHTRVGHLTHNNGGWCVKESPEEIMEMIKNLEGGPNKESSETGGTRPSKEIAEQIQEDLRTYLDGMEPEIIFQVCQIVVDNFKK